MTACMLAYTFYESDNRVRRYAEALAKRGDRVEAIVLRHEGQVKYEVIRGVHVYRIQTRSRNERGPLSYLVKLLLFLVRSAVVLTAHHLRDPYDVIHVHSVPDFEVFAATVPRLLGAKVILDIHDIIPEFYASKFRITEQSALFRVLLLTEKVSTGFAHHTIISNDLWYEKLTRRSVPPARCTALINYPDPSIFAVPPAGRVADGRLTALYPGSLNQHQGLDLAVEAMALLRDKVPQLDFRIIGDGPDREKLKLMVQEKGLEGRMRIDEVMPIERIAEAMTRADLGVVPKRKDTFGNEAFSTKIMEFMAMGVPVIAANTRVDQFYFGEGLVQFFESGDARDLAAKMLELVQNPVRREELRQRGHAFIEGNNWDVKKAEYFRLVDGLVAHPGRELDKSAAASR